MTCSVVLPHPAAEGAHGAAQAAVRTLATHRYIDQATKALVVDINLYCQHLDRLVALRFVLELPAGGGVLPSVSAKSGRASPDPFDPEAGDFSAVFVAATACFYLGYIAQLVRRATATQLQP